MRRFMQDQEHVKMGKSDGEDPLLGGGCQYGEVMREGHGCVCWPLRRLRALVWWRRLGLRHNARDSQGSRCSHQRVAAPRLESSRLPSSSAPDWSCIRFGLVSQMRLVCYRRWAAVAIRQDYDLAPDIGNSKATKIIYAYRGGAGVDQHPNSNRGAYLVNFDTGDSSEVSSTWY